MKTRVTITLEPEVHRAAKRVARSRSTSLSGLVERLLVSTANPTISLVDRMIGSGELREPQPGDDPLGDRLRAKYL